MIDFTNPLTCEEWYEGRGGSGIYHDGNSLSGFGLVRVQDEDNQSTGIIIKVPEFGSTVSMFGSKYIQFSLGGVPNAIKGGQEYYKFDWSFSGIADVDIEVYHAFFKLTVGKKLLVTDQTGETYSMIALRQPAYIQKGKDYNTFLLELEGILE